MKSHHPNLVQFLRCFGIHKGGAVLSGSQSSKTKLRKFSSSLPWSTGDAEDWWKTTWFWNNIWKWYPTRIPRSLSFPYWQVFSAWIFTEMKLIACVPMFTEIWEVLRYVWQPLLLDWSSLMLCLEGLGLQKSLKLFMETCRHICNCFWFSSRYRHYKFINCASLLYTIS